MNATVNGIEYQPVKPSGERWYILIVDNRGLTFVGRADLSGDGEQIIIRNARCLIVWGTTKHLAELVDGPTSNTKLGARQDVMVFRRNLVLAYETDGAKWQR